MAEIGATMEIVPRQSLKVALCFFGIPRSVRFTHQSIWKNLIAPLRALAELRIYAHFYNQTEIANARSKEFGKLNPDDYRLLPLDSVQFDAPRNDEVKALFEAVESYGAGWRNDFASLSNLCHQLISLKKVTEACLADEPDLVVFARPDLLYHDCLRPAIEAALAAESPSLFVPYWQENGGLNDRFCLARGKEAARAYGMRGSRAVELCRERQIPLPAEGLVKFATHDIRICRIPQRASRVRFDGRRRWESFDTPDYHLRVANVRRRIRHAGLRDTVIAILRVAQACRHGPRYRGLQSTWSQNDLREVIAGKSD